MSDARVAGGDATSSLPIPVIEMATPIARRYARRYAGLYLAGRGECDVEDLAQEALLAVWSRRDKIEAAANPRVAVAVTCRSAILDATVGSRRRDAGAVGAARSTRARRRPAISPDESRDVREAVGDLPRPLRTVIARKYFEGMTGTEAAKAEGIPASLVKSRVEAAFARLRDSLGPPYAADFGRPIPIRGHGSMRARIAYVSGQGGGGRRPRAVDAESRAIDVGPQAIDAAPRPSMSPPQAAALPRSGESRARRTRWIVLSSFEELRRP